VPLGMLAATTALLRACEQSVGLAGPTPSMLEDEDPSKLPLFRHLPSLRGKLAWRPLGDFPTPVHDASVGAHRFQVKREDLSSSLYGGNKVRTLEHQLAVVEANLEASARQGSAEQDMGAVPRGSIGVLGSSGSNQVVAAAVHSARQNSQGRFRLPKVKALWCSPDAPDLDNSLNLLSTLSLSHVGAYSTGVAAVFDALKMLTASKAAGGGTLIPLGGNSPSGVLGHVSAALELAEQIAEGDAAAVDAIYLAVGSSCTISGLVVGVVLSRHLGLAAYQNPSFKIHGVLVHPLFALAQRTINLHSSAPFLPLTISHTVREACKALTSLGGPDLERDALLFVETSVTLHTEASLVGEYGAHSSLSRAAANEFDARGEVRAKRRRSEGSAVVGSSSGGEEGVSGQEGGGAGKSKAVVPPPLKLWLCGHFVAKAYAALLADLEADPELKAVLWQTKSTTQPLGAQDEWAKLRAMPSDIKAWANQGKAESALRPGSVNVEGGGPEDYRGLMTKIE